MPASSHIPVLRRETIEALAVQPGGRYIDCTLGGGGHADAIMQRSAPGGQLLGIDADMEAIKVARSKLEPYRGSVLLVNDNFAHLHDICLKYDFYPVHGILFDLGLSSLQLSGKGRGFSFQHDAPLDMRFNPRQKLTAADIVNTYPEVKLAQMIRAYGEEVFSYRIARCIVRERPLKTTLQLARLVEKVAGKRRTRIHPATRTFQALRIAVNQELENLESALKQAVDLLGYEGRLAVISYHSLEDRIVKQFMQREAKNCICPPGIPTCVCGHKASLKVVSRKIITPSEKEIQYNPRSRSARLRVAERIIDGHDCFGTAVMPDFLSKNCSTGWRKPALLKRIKMAFQSA